MKKMLYALCLMAGLAVVACEQEEAFVPHLDFPPTEVTLPTAGTEDLAEPVMVKFNANAAWTATLTGEGVAEWLSISPKSGEAGEAAIKLDAIANKGNENRTASLEIAVEGLETVVVKVTQLQKNAIDVNAEDAYTVSFEGGSVEVEVGANVAYTYEASAEWLVETKAYTTDKLTFTVPAPEVNAAARTATVTVYSELGVVKVVTITQEAWSPIKWTNSLSEMGAAAGRVGVAALGDKVYFTAGGELWTVDEATGANATKLALPEGFVAGGVHADDAGNLLVSGEDRSVSNGVCGQLQLFKANADGTYTALVDYNSANFWCTEMGNFRVKGDVTKNAVITAYVAGGPGASYYLVWEVKDGVVAAPAYGLLPDYSWDASTGVVAPAGATLADGLYCITYGDNYDVFYYDGAEWTATWDSPASWMENFNCISTAEVGGKKYLALTMSCHFDYDYTDLVVLDVTDPKAAAQVFAIQVRFHTVNASGLTYSDVQIKAEGSNLAAYVVDSWMDTVDKYVFPL